MAIYQDTYVEVTSDTKLHLHTPTGANAGTSWSLFIDSSGGLRWGSVRQASDNLAASANWGNGALVYILDDDPASADYDVNITLTTVPNVAGSPVFVIGRATDASNFYGALVYYATANPDFLLFKVVSGTVTLLDSDDTDFVDGDKLTLSMSGTTIVGKKNDTTILSATDAALSSAGNGGFGWGNVYTALDDVISNWVVDDFYIEEATASGYTLDFTIGTVAINGSAVNVLDNRLLGVSAGSIEISGVDISALYGRVIDTFSGSLEINGSAIEIPLNRLLACVGGSVSVTGSSLGVLHSRLLNVTSGSIAVTGSDIVLVYNPGTGVYTLLVGGGSLSIAGNAVNLVAGRLLNITAGSITVTGDNILSLYGRILDTTGLLAVTGAPAVLLVNRLLSLVGSVEIIGSNLLLQRSLLLDTSADSLIITGSSVNLFHNLLLLFPSASVAITGQTIRLVYSGEQVIGAILFLRKRLTTSLAAKLRVHTPALTRTRITVTDLTKERIF